MQSRRNYAVTKKLRSYEGITQLRRNYAVTKKLRSYEEITQLRRNYAVTKELREGIMQNELPRYKGITQSKFVCKIICIYISFNVCNTLNLIYIYIFNIYHKYINYSNKI